MLESILDYFIHVFFNWWILGGCMLDLKFFVIIYRICDFCNVLMLFLDMPSSLCSMFKCLIAVYTFVLCALFEGVFGVVCVVHGVLSVIINYY
jgi:hypothetical protein